MAGDQTLSKLNGAVSCVVTVLVCLAVGAMAFQYGPQAFSYVREATTFKPAASSSFTFTPVMPMHGEWDFNGGEFETIPTMGKIDVSSIMSGNANGPTNDANRAMRDYRP
jgi:hypothetical protein